LSAVHESFDWGRRVTARDRVKQAVQRRFVAKLEESTALRYALAPVCIAVAVLLHLSAIGPFLHPTGLFVIGIVAAAWFGGAGPGFLAALLAALVLPQFVPRLYPLIADFFDLPRFLTFAVTALAVGWGTTFRRRAEAALRQSEHELRTSRGELEMRVAKRTADLRFSEERYARAMDASSDGLWEWNPMTDELFVSLRARQLLGVPDGVEIRTRADLKAHGGFHSEDRQRIDDAFRECLASGFGGLDIEYRVINPAGEQWWIRSRGRVFPGSPGQPALLTGSLTNITERKRAAAALSLSEERYARAMEAADEGNWEWNMVTDEMFLSQRMKEILGFAPDTQFASRVDFFDRHPIHPDDRQRVADASAASLSGTAPRYEIEYRVVPRPGELRWVRSRGKVFRDDQHRPVCISGSFTDITARKLADEALRRSEERFALAVAGATDGIWDWDLLTGDIFLSDQAQILHGIAPGPSVRKRAEWRALWKLQPDDAEARARAADDYIAGRTAAFDGEWRVQRPDGSYRWIRTRGFCVRDEAGRATRMAGSVSDIDAQKCAEAALRLSEERYALAMAASGEGHWDWKVASDEFYADPQMLELYGFPPGTTFAGRSDFLARLPLHPEDRPKWEAAAAAHFAGTTARIDMEIRIVRLGETRWIHLTGLVSRNAAGDPTRWTGSVADVTDRRAAEDALRLSEHRYALAMEATGDGHWDWDIPADKMYVSPLLLDICGLPADLTFASRSEWVDRVPFYPGERPKYARVVAEHFAGKTARLDAELRIVPRGETRWIHMTGHCARDASGTPIRWTGSVTDVTARKRVDEELRARQEMLDLAQNAARAVAFEWWIGAGEGENRWSPDLEAMYGIAPGSYDGTYESWKKLVYPEDWPKVRAAIKAAQESGDVDAEYRVLHKRGTIRWLQAKGRMFFDPDGKPARIVGFMLDVTDRHLAEEELQRMEHQLRQAQRLESMGTLAGGIAHDFNNLLGAILGYGEMALRDAPAGSRLRRDLDSIMIAGERGRALVDRILAFSRSGVGERVAVHVEEVVRETLGLFAAKLPKGIVLEDRLRAGRAAVMGDATQIHQVLMNLVTNAVQAMTAGGTLRVSLDRASVRLPRVATTGTVAATDHVVLEVADTGSGIPPEVLERIFDPFFTTKEVGVGTGLGLSLVHGIVTGLGGAIDVTTTTGKGSVFTVYLPRAGNVTSLSKPKPRVEPRTQRGDRQRVLVVDDEESLVRLATETLKERDYIPVAFTASAAALDAFLADPERFDAVITDESMPGLSGSELIRRVRQVRPTIPILLVSGYLSAAVVRRAREAGADEVLKKPLTARQLATSLDRVLRTAKARPEDVGVSAATESAPKGRRRTAATRSAARPTRRR
jgi:PAS domain S-box-containing protein